MKDGIITIVLLFIIAPFASAQGLDDRFVPIEDLPADFVEKLSRDVQDYTIDAESLRSQVAAGGIAVNGWNPETKESSINPDSVRTQSILESYAQAVVLRDENIVELGFTETALRISYRSSGKLFGFLPVRIRSRIEIHVPKIGEQSQAGQIRVEYPWYHFLIKKSFTESAIATAFATQVALVNSQQQAQRVAQYLQVIATVLRPTI